MKNVLIVSAVLFSLLFFVQATMPDNVTDEGKGIVFFEGKWQEALALAKKENKYIFLDAYASWCGPCKMMQHKVFPSTEAGDFFNKRFINVKMDMEKGEGPELARKYRVTAYPTFFIIDSDGKVKKSTMGYHNTKQLIEFVSKVVKK